ncbi:MAG TPA: SdrD B-like domain-containing protein [Tepidisphaeraceae bacterium]
MSVRCIEVLEPRRLLADTLSAAIDVAKPKQTIDAIGAALNSGWQPSEYRSADFINKAFNDLGVSALRSALDPGWELSNDDNNPNTYNWAKYDDTAIGTTMEFFAQAKARGVKTFLLTVWTPPAWAKTNKAAAHGGQLRPEFREEYAEYITSALVRAKVKWGVDITHVSIANEPWFTEPYPSAMWTPTQLRETLKTVAARFAREGLSAQLVMPEDVSSIFRTQKYVQAIADDPAANAAVPIIGSHYLNDQNMPALATQAATVNKKIWYTEVGNGNPDLAGAVGLARGIDSAFVRGQANAWINWQLSNSNDFEALMKNGVPTTKYHALKHFAHFVRPGDQRVDVQYLGDSVRVSAFKGPTTGALTIVMSSVSTTDVNVNLSLAGMAVPAKFRQYRTSATENCAEIAPLTGAANMTVALAPNSIVTLYSGPDLVTPMPTTASTRVTPTQWADAWNSNALRQAAMKGEHDKVVQLIAGGADVNAAFGNGWTPLFTAAASPYNKADLIIRDLLAAGANPLKRDVEGLTALHVAAMNEIPAFGTVDTLAAKRVELLLAAGVPVNAQDHYGRTALMYAAMLPKVGGNFGASNTSVLQALLAAGANRDIKDSSGRTALDYAKQEYATENIAVLSDPGAIEARVFKDVNGNATQDSGDTGLAGVTVYVDLNNNALFDTDEPTAATDANGVATFAGVLMGTYTLRAAAPDASYTAAEAFTTINVTSNSVVVAPLPFVPAGTAQLSGYVINDKNTDGRWSSGEAGIAGRTVYLDANKNGTLDAGERTQVTASNGKYVFTGLAAGTYSLRQILPEGSTQTRPASGTALSATVLNGAIRSGLDFCVTGTVTPPPPPPPPTGTGSVRAYVINDLNRDGKWTSGEKGVTGRTVWMDLDNDGTLDAGEKTATTAANGSFEFTGLGSGTYRFRQVLPTGWVQTYPTAALSATVIDGQLKSGSSMGTATA